MTESRWGYFELKSNCRGCGRTLPVNGPVARVRCASCFTVNPVPMTIYDSAIEMIDWEGIDLADGETKYRLLAKGSRGTYDLDWGRHAPSCAECGILLPEISPQAGEFHCPGCGVTCSNFAPAGSFARLYPEVGQIVLGEQAATQDSGRKISVDPSKAKPIFVGCENCGGSLSITADVPRHHDCQYCGTSVWIPDDLWERLHPVESTRGWYVRLDGPPRQGKLDQALADQVNESFDRELRSLEKGTITPVRGPSRWVCLQIHTECPACKHGIPVNGPLPHVVCSACGHVMQLDPELIGGFLTWVEETKPVVEGVVLRPNGQQFKRKVTRVPPTCARCDAVLPEGVPGTESTIQCPGCEATYETFPVPAFLEPHCGAARQIYCGQKEPDPAPDEGTASRAFACPACGGELGFTAETERIHTCEFCSADVFITDELWTLLHPVANVRPWFVDSVTVAPQWSEPVEEDPTWGEPEPDSGNKRTVLILVAIGAIAVIGALVVALASC
ncbi:MAG: hypothetical protein JRF63_09585 [Deltaproteobacteria bacterium]|nr:hypothetical protein [Deltaproteobacteria bacterium]